MIRTFQLSQDNTPVNTTISRSLTSEDIALGYIAVETGTPVSWAVIVQANVSLTNNTPDHGPYFYNPVDAVTLEYDVRNISGDTVSYASGSLKVYYNGLLLTKDVEYTEGPDAYKFTFIVGAAALPEPPDTADTISITYRTSASNGTVGSRTVQVDKNSFYPNQATGFKVLYENFSLGDPINLEILYR